MSEATPTSRRLTRAVRRHWLWLALAGALGALFVYAVSFFAAAPRTETITTHAPAFNANRRPMREVEYRARRAR